MAKDATAQGIPATMRAVQQTAYGDAETWRMAELPVPTPGAREVLVRAEAAGVDRGTWHLMTGRPCLARPFIGMRRPKNAVPGLDLAGRVVALGAEVTRFAVGDEVLGAGRGSFAEYACAPEHKLARRPAGLPAAQAAALSIPG